jgi:hypothetical protein
MARSCRILRRGEEPAEYAPSEEARAFAAWRNSGESAFAIEAQTAVASELLLSDTVAGGCQQTMPGVLYTSKTVSREFNQSEPNCLASSAQFKQCVE